MDLNNPIKERIVFSVPELLTLEGLISTTPSPGASTGQYHSVPKVTNTNTPSPGASAGQYQSLPKVKFARKHLFGGILWKLS